MKGAAVVLRADALRLPLADESVDLIVTSPPYFALRSYRDGDEHYAGQIGSEPTPQAFLEALWAVMAECWRVLKPTGSCFINLGDKRSGSGGHNNAGISRASQFPLPIGANGLPEGEKRRRTAYEAEEIGDLRRTSRLSEGAAPYKAARRNAPDRYNQAAFGRAKSKMLLPHRFAEGCMDGLASPCGCPVLGGYRCPTGMHRSDLTCVLHGRCRTPWIMRSDIVWQKLNGLPESVTDRCRDSHEYLFHFVKEGRYFAAVDEVREDHAPKQSGLAGTFRRTGTDKEQHKSELVGISYNGAKASGGVEGYHPLGKLPGSVWALPSEPLIVSDEVKAHYDLPDHFAAFPTELVRRVILGWSPAGVCTECGEGRRPVVAKTSKHLATRSEHSMAHRALEPLARTRMHDQTTSVEATITGYACRCGIPAPPTRPSLVLDIFGGTGTTAGVARALGRIGVSVDLSHDYSRLADWRIHRSGHFAKVAQRTHRENQQTMFEVPA